MVEYVTLTCPSCGGKLKISNDIEHFACGYCGNEYIVNRSGGIVSLGPVMEKLKDIQVKTDKTTSELAINRLEKELSSQHIEFRSIINEILNLHTAIYSIVVYDTAKVQNVVEWDRKSDKEKLNALEAALPESRRFFAERGIGRVVDLLLSGNTPKDRKQISQYYEAKVAQAKQLYEQMMEKQTQLKRHQQIVNS